MATASVQSDLISSQPIPFRRDSASDGGHDGEVVPVEQYLGTMYHPDCDYVDGHLEERNLGEFDHNRVQKRLLILFSQKEALWDVECIQEQRLRVAASNYRVPDFMVLSGRFDEDQIVHSTPLLIVEVLSPEDTFKRLLRKVKDYAAMVFGTCGPLIPRPAPPTVATPRASTSSAKTSLAFPIR